jgi:hypothetical protein
LAAALPACRARAPRSTGRTREWLAGARAIGEWRRPARMRLACGLGPKGCLPFLPPRRPLPCLQFDQILASYKKHSKQWSATFNRFAEGEWLVERCWLCGRGKSLACCRAGRLPSCLCCPMPTFSPSPMTLPNQSGYGGASARWWDEGAPSRPPALCALSSCFFGRAVPFSAVKRT